VCICLPNINIIEIEPQCLDINIFVSNNFNKKMTRLKI